MNNAAIRDVLDTFCSISGQTVSETKSRVYFSPNMDRESLCDILGFASTPFLGKYLGFPLKQSGTSHDYDFILDRVKQKLAEWKANCLSLAGRRMLIQSSFADIPSYIMQCSYLPGRVLDGLDRVNRNFLWGSTNSTKKIHWVGWEKVTKPKEERGLGLQTAKGRNVALLSKLIWRFHTEGEASWVKVLKMKYCSQRRRVAANADSLPYSSTWAAMKKGVDTFNKGSRWLVTKNSNLNIWHNGRMGGPLGSLSKVLFLKKQMVWKLRTLCLMWAEIGRSLHLN